MSPVTEWPEPQDEADEARQFFEDLLGIANSHLFFHVQRGHAVVAASISSKKPDKVTAALSNESSAAALGPRL